MSLFASLFLVAPAPVPFPERELLDAFKAACSRTGNDLEPMKADAVRAGWIPMGEDGDPRIGRLVKLGKDAVDKDGKATGANFRRSLGGRDVFLIVSRYEDKDGIWGSGCRVYHFEATAPLDGKLLTAWMGKPPSAVQVPSPGITKQLWEPGWKPGIGLEIGHVAPDHPIGKQFGLSGNILTAQAIGGF